LGKELKDWPCKYSNKTFFYPLQALLSVKERPKSRGQHRRTIQATKTDKMTGRCHLVFTYGVVIWVVISVAMWVDQGFHQGCHPIFCLDCHPGCQLGCHLVCHMMFLSGLSSNECHQVFFWCCHLGFHLDCHLDCNLGCHLGCYLDCHRGCNVDCHLGCQQSCYLDCHLGCHLGFHTGCCLNCHLSCHLVLSSSNDI
jgi:hypothetical protein